MLKNLRFPFLYLIELGLWVLLLAGFSINVSFFGAKPLASFDLQGKSLPASWEAAVQNHGKYMQGYLISEHPLFFAFGIIITIGAVVMLWPVHRAQQLQRQSGSNASPKSHSIAQGVVVAVIAAMGYLLVFNILFGVSPA